MVKVAYSPRLMEEQTSASCLVDSLALHHCSKRQDSQRHSCDHQISSEGLQGGHAQAVPHSHAVEKGTLGILPLFEGHGKLETYKGHNMVCQSILNRVLDRVTLSIHEMVGSIIA